MFQGLGPELEITEHLEACTGKLKRWAIIKHLVFHATYLNFSLWVVHMKLYNKLSIF